MRFSYRPKWRADGVNTLLFAREREKTRMKSSLSFGNERSASGEVLNPPHCMEMRKTRTRRTPTLLVVTKKGTELETHLCWVCFVLQAQKHPRWVFQARKRTLKTKTHRRRCTFVLSMSWAQNHPCWRGHAALSMNTPWCFHVRRMWRQRKIVDERVRWFIAYPAFSRLVLLFDLLRRGKSSSGLAHATKTRRWGGANLLAALKSIVDIFISIWIFVTKKCTC